MNIKDYQASNQVNGLVSQINNAIEDKKKIQSKHALSQEAKANEFAKLSDDLMKALTQENLFIQKEYFQKFEEGKETTINPTKEEVELVMDGEEKKSEYEQVFADSFGPFKPFNYFMTTTKIVIVDWEPYMKSKELDDYRRNRRPILGGHLQAKEFPTYNMLEASTHRLAVDFSKLLLSKFSVDKTKDEVMQDHMCILEHNHFPALAFADSSSSTKSNVQIFAEWNRYILSSLLEFYAGDIVIGHRDFLNYLSSPYEGMFNVAIQKGIIVPEGESTEHLLKAYPDASIIGRKILRSWFNHILGGDGASALLDERGTLWIGYVHFQSRRGDQWSHQDQEKLASWIHRILSEVNGDK